MDKVPRNLEDPSPVRTKCCNRCGVVKPVSDFYRDEKNKHWSPRCKPCTVAENRERREAKRAKNPPPPRQLKTPSLDYNGRRYYLLPSGYWSSPKPEPTVILHRAIWEEAHGPIPKGYDIHHRDRNRGNNALENLEMVTRAEHMARCHKDEKPRGEANAQAKLTEEQVLEIRTAYVRRRKGGAAALGHRYGVSTGTILDIVQGRTWQHLDHPKPEVPDHCPYGHPYTPENTYTSKGRGRACRACWTKGNRAFRARERQKKLQNEQLDL